MKIKVGSFILITKDREVIDYECMSVYGNTREDFGKHAHSFCRGEIYKVVDIAIKGLNQPYHRLYSTAYGLQREDGPRIYLYDSIVELDGAFKVLPNGNLKTINTLFGAV